MTTKKHADSKTTQRSAFRGGQDISESEAVEGLDSDKVQVQIFRLTENLLRDCQSQNLGPIQGQLSYDQLHHQF